jgi:hypothetical protein
MDGKAITTETLRQTLFATIDGLLEGQIEVKAAAQVANLADKIIKTGDLEMRYTEHVAKIDSQDHGISPGPMLLGQYKNTGS